MWKAIIINELIEKVADIDLMDLHMDLRLYYCLLHGGFGTLAKVMNASAERLLRIRNFDKTCEQELSSIIQFAKTATREQILDYCQKGVFPESDSTQGYVGSDKIINDLSDFTIGEYWLGIGIDYSTVMFKGDRGDYCEDILLAELKLSTRVYKRLISHGISTLRELVSMKYSELIRIGGLGENSIREVYDTIFMRVVRREIIYDPNRVKDTVDSITEFFSPIIDNSLIEAKEEAISFVVIKHLNYKTRCIVDNDSFMLEVAKVNPINTLLRDRISDFVSKKIYQGLDKRILLSIVSGQNRQYEYIIEPVLENMILTGQVNEVPGKKYNFWMVLNGKGINLVRIEKLLHITLDNNRIFVPDDLPEGSDGPGLYKEIAWLLNLVEKNEKELISFGVELSDSQIWMIYYYDKQCKMEFDSRLMERMGKLGMKLCVSCQEL